MAHDALEQSLSESGRPLEQQVRDLQAILPHLLSAIEEARDQGRAGISRCMAAAASATARAELAVKTAQEAVPVAREAALAELLKVAQAANDEGPRHAEPKPKRKLPAGWGGIVAGAAIALAALKAHRAAAAAAAAMALTAATVAPMTAAIAHDNDVHLIPAAARHHHYHPVRGVIPDPAVLPVRRRDRDTLARSADRERPSPKVPAPTGAATPPPSPAPSPATSPVPSPTVTPVPVPAVTPTGLLAWDH